MSEGEGWTYLVALGSNRRHPRYGTPRRVLTAALAALRRHGLTVTATAPILASRPIGPSRREYANTAALIDTTFTPDALLSHLKAMERGFGRRPGGRRWGDRVLDLDIVLWSGGSFTAPNLTIPHPRFRERAFVLEPAARIAGSWRDPVTGLTLRHLYARLTRADPVLS